MGLGWLKVIRGMRLYSRWSTVNVTCGLIGATVAALLMALVFLQRAPWGVSFILLLMAMVCAFILSRLRCPTVKFFREANPKVTEGWIFGYGPFSRTCIYIWKGRRYWFVLSPHQLPLLEDCTPFKDWEFSP